MNGYHGACWGDYSPDRWEAALRWLGRAKNGTSRGTELARPGGREAGAIHLRELVPRYCLRLPPASRTWVVQLFPFWDGLPTRQNWLASSARVCPHVTRPTASTSAEPDNHNRLIADQQATHPLAFHSRPCSVPSRLLRSAWVYSSRAMPRADPVTQLASTNDSNKAKHVKVQIHTFNKPAHALLTEACFERNRVSYPSASFDGECSSRAARQMQSRHRMALELPSYQMTHRRC